MDAVTNPIQLLEGSLAADACLPGNPAAGESSSNLVGQQVSAGPQSQGFA